MAISNRARFALIAALAVLLVAGIAGATLASRDRAEDTGSNGSTDTGNTGSTGAGSTGSTGGSSPGSAGGGEPGSPGGGDTPTGSVPSGPATDEPASQPVVPQPGMVDVYPRPFDSAVVADDDLTITIDFVSGIEPCYVLDRVAVAYGPAAVTITLFEGHDPSADDVACIEIGVYKSVTITLDEPLAGRAIVDGAL